MKFDDDHNHNWHQEQQLNLHNLTLDDRDKLPILRSLVKPTVKMVFGEIKYIYPFAISVRLLPLVFVVTIRVVLVFWPILSGHFFGILKFRALCATIRRRFDRRVQPRARSRVFAQARRRAAIRTHKRTVNTFSVQNKTNGQTHWQTRGRKSRVRWRTWIRRISMNLSFAALTTLVFYSLSFIYLQFTHYHV